MVFKNSNFNLPIKISSFYVSYFISYVYFINEISILDESENSKPPDVYLEIIAYEFVSVMKNSLTFKK